jgi:arylsulfatase A-like enzyme
MLEPIGELEHNVQNAMAIFNLRGDQRSHFQRALRTPGIFHWPKGIPWGPVEAQPAGSVDLLPILPMLGLRCQ